MLILFLYGILIYLSWYKFSLFVLVAWIPIFKILHSNQSKLKTIITSLVLFIVYNLVVTYWLIEWDVFKGITVIIINSLLMALVVFATLVISKQNTPLRNISFIIFWIFFEYIHHVWTFNWPWLTLGNTFANSPSLIQWYKYTGVLGGSLWILLVNLFLYQQIEKGKIEIKKLGFLLAPILISIIIYFYDDITEKRLQEVSVGVMLTDFSSYNYVSDSTKYALAKKEIQSNSRKDLKYILLPETYFKENLWMEEFGSSKLYRELQHLSKTSKAKIISGYFINRESDKGIYTRGYGLIKFDQYNVAIQIDETDRIPIKIKKVFIPIQEHTPSYLSVLDKEGYANFKLLNNNKDYFHTKESKFFVCICYEAINGIFFSDRWTNENMIFMLASESFLNGNETAMHQYQNICRIRAIEASKFLFKSSNSGLSSVIDEKGNVLSSKKANNKLELLKWKGYTNDIHTFYSTWGWLINKAPIVALTLLLLNLLFKKKLVYLHLGNWN